MIPVSVSPLPFVGASEKNEFISMELMMKAAEKNGRKEGEKKIASFSMFFNSLVPLDTSLERIACLLF